MILKSLPNQDSLQYYEIIYLKRRCACIYLKTVAILGIWECFLNSDLYPCIILPQTEAIATEQEVIWPDWVLPLLSALHQAMCTFYV